MSILPASWVGNPSPQNPARPLTAQLWKLDTVRLARLQLQDLVSLFLHGRLHGRREERNETF